MTGDHNSAAYEPTQAEIAAACAKIQQGWSDDERIGRRQRLVQPVTCNDFATVAADARLWHDERLEKTRKALRRDV